MPRMMVRAGRAKLIVRAKVGMLDVDILGADGLVGGGFNGA